MFLLRRIKVEPGQTKAGLILSGSPEFKVASGGGNKGMTTETETRWKCPPHFWIIDAENVGRCKYCPAVKDFGKLLRKEKQKVSFKQAAIAKNTHHTGRKGRKRKNEL